jgi:hypothetical protein
VNVHGVGNHERVNAKPNWYQIEPADSPTGNPPAVPPASGVRFFYVDDSGAQETGYIVYSWIECTAPSSLPAAATRQPTPA